MPDHDSRGDVVDLFAGPGGWDIAARQLGLDPLGIEWDDAACATRKAAGLRTLQRDVAECKPRAFAPCTGLTGSPPCPTFSAAGSGAARHLTELLGGCLVALAGGHDRRDEARTEAFDTLRPVAWEAEQAAARKAKREPDRAKAEARARRDADMSVLVVEPLRWALALEPEWVALEQVPSVLPLWRMVAQLLETRGYSTWAGVLEAERYGVPQTRERAVLMARRGGHVHPPKPTHHRFVPNTPRPERVEGLFGSLEPWVSMVEALGWGMTERPSLTITTPHGGAATHVHGGGSGSDRAVARERERGAWTVRSGQSVAGEGRAERSTEEPAFSVTSRTDLWTHERPATTIVGGRRSEGGMLVGRQLPPGERRDVGGHPDAAPSEPDRATAVRVTVEEAAALQTFPPGYPFQGSMTAQFQQVGNAVPPLLALRVLEALHVR